jgi:hypothetical protein
VVVALNVDFLNGVLGFFPRKRTKASGASAIPGLSEGVTFNFLIVVEYFG